MIENYYRTKKSYGRTSIEINKLKMEINRRQEIIKSVENSTWL